MRFVSNQRVAKVDIPSSEGDSMPRATETLTVQTEPLPNPEVKAVVLNFGSSAEAKPKPFVLNFGNHSPSITDNQKGGTNI
jgi:hypothetical protein